MIMKKMSTLLNNSNTIYAFLLSIKGLSNKVISSRIAGINRDPNEVCIKKRGECKYGMICYEININDKSAGFFALMRWICSALHYADSKGFKPIVLLGNQTKYYDSDYSEENNPFNYYFEPVSDLTVEDIEHAYNVVTYESKHLLDMNLPKDFQTDSSIVVKFARIWKKYIKFNKKTTEFLECELVDKIREKKTLGVHVRGTDYTQNYNGHPIAITVEEEIEKAKMAIQEYGYEQIFVATDDAEYVKKIKEQLSDQVLYFNDTFRSLDGTAVHDSIDSRKLHRYRLGLEVLRDVYALSSCKGLIAGQSNVSFFAMVLNRVLWDEFESCEICNKGFNNNKKIYEKNK